MRHYEIVLLIRPDQAEQTSGMIERYKSLITASRGQVHRLEDWGRKSLAYFIEKISKAHYVLMNIECDQKTYEELKHAFRYNDAILRFLSIRQESALIEASSMMQKESKTVKEEGGTPYLPNSSKSSRLSVGNFEKIDYKDIPFLSGFVSEVGKIIPGRVTGVSAKYQRQVAKAIRRARYLALLPYCDTHALN